MENTLWKYLDVENCRGLRNALTKNKKQKTKNTYLLQTAKVNHFRYYSTVKIDI